MKTYVGQRREDGTAVVLVTNGENDRALNPRLDLYNHSPSGFEWGYGGSGPAQTALAMLADALNSDGRAIAMHQEFKWRVIANAPREGFRLSHDDVLAIVSEIEAEGVT